MAGKQSLSEARTLEKVANARINFNMTPREVLEFLMRLASDDDFRARLEKQPHKALADNHIHVPVKDVPLHVHLPPKDQLQEALMDIMTGQELRLRALPFNVDPGFWYFIDFLIFLLARSGSKPCKWPK